MHWPQRIHEFVARLERRVADVTKERDDLEDAVAQLRAKVRNLKSEKARSDAAAEQKAIELEAHVMKRTTELDGEKRRLADKERDLELERETLEEERNLVSKRFEAVRKREAKAEKREKEIEETDAKLRERERKLESKESRKRQSPSPPSSGKFIDLSEVCLEHRDRGGPFLLGGVQLLVERTF